MAERVAFYSASEQEQSLWLVSLAGRGCRDAKGSLRPSETHRWLKVECIHCFIILGDSYFNRVLVHKNKTLSSVCVK